MKVESPSYSAPALGKGLDILELLAIHEHALSMKAIADELGRSKSEIFRMLMVLLDRGYITRDAASDTFLLTNRLFNLGLRTPRVRDLLSRAAPIMRQLAEERSREHARAVNRHERQAQAALGERPFPRPATQRLEETQGQQRRAAQGQHRVGGHRQHRRHEDGADPVGELLHRGLGGLGRFHQLHDLRQRRLGADLGDAHDQPAVVVDGPADDRVAWDAGDGERFAGEH